MRICSNVPRMFGSLDLRMQKDYLELDILNKQIEKLQFLFLQMGRLLGYF